jgi:hypothetical protein
VNEIAQHRTSRLTVIAWLSGIAGLVKLVGLPIFVWALLDEASSWFASPQAAPLSPEWLARLARFVTGQLHVFVAFWMLLGLLMVVAAAGISRRRAWARTGLAAVCWFGLFEAPLVAAFIYSVRRMLLRPGVAGGESLASSLASRFWASLAWLVIYVVLLILLKTTNQGDRTDGQAEGQSHGS